jgi:hypothetical protein
LVYLLGLNAIQLALIKCPAAARKDIFGFEDEATIFYTWLAAASVHDFGYPFEVAEKISERLSKLYQSFHLSGVAGGYELLQRTANIEREPFLGTVSVSTGEVEKTVIDTTVLLREDIQVALNLDKSDADQLVIELRKGKNHGYVSAMILYNSVLNELLAHDQWNTVKNSEMFNSLRYAAGAVALHNARTLEHRRLLGAGRNRYAYLLFILDNIQDWSRVFQSFGGRPTFQLVQFYLDVANSTMSLDYYLRCEPWNSDAESNIKNAIEERRRMILAPIPVASPLGVNVVVRYHTSQSIGGITKHEIDCSL